jgi:hypothetical protein
MKIRKSDPFSYFPTLMTKKLFKVEIRDKGRWYIEGTDKRINQRAVAPLTTSSKNRHYFRIRNGVAEIYELPEE